ncbi:hypothetical protein HMPREF0758_4961 [Serratia odorifera DSM 4582]|uniref:Uncharacterized protein n=1 Tax=Serratia odorifera DSM 4582 TaxID=667129 RepID=D4E9W1_SEROD|nr:hypothetical protein HMPREF0758_4961 [Serratia odorifera DSM 4582]
MSIFAKVDIIVNRKIQGKTVLMERLPNDSDLFPLFSTGVK